MRLYLDASTIIYSIESTAPLREAVLKRLSLAKPSEGGTLLTSRLSCLECRVKPLRDAHAELLATYDKIFAQGLLRVIEIDAAVVNRATELRARYGLRTPDAIHMATAIEEHSDVFLTGDRNLVRCTELPVEVL